MANSTRDAKVKLAIRAVLAKVGLQVGSFTGSFQEHHLNLLTTAGISTVWDVGAHVGQHGAWLRLHGYKGHIISVEPGREAYEELNRRSQGDECWTAVHAAAGAHADATTLNVSLNGQSSSMLPMLERHVLSAPNSTYVRTESIRTCPLDSLVAELTPPGPYALKLDVQGYELQALEGASRLLSETRIADVELSLTPMYDGGAAWQDVISVLVRSGLSLCDIERVLYDPRSGDLLQVNGLFRRANLSGMSI